MASIGLLLNGCSSYGGMSALHRPSLATDALPPELKFLEKNLGSPKNFLLLSEDAGVKYFAYESEDFTSACLAVYPLDKPAQWEVSCDNAVTKEREIVTVIGPDGQSAKLVTTGLDTAPLENQGWRKIHENILVGFCTPWRIVLLQAHVSPPKTKNGSGRCVILNLHRAVDCSRPTAWCGRDCYFRLQSTDAGCL